MKLLKIKDRGNIKSNNREIMYHIQSFLNKSNS